MISNQIMWKIRQKSQITEIFFFKVAELNLKGQIIFHVHLGEIRNKEVSTCCFENHLCYFEGCIYLVQSVCHKAQAESVPLD